jgi:micrococcal nuclease
MSSAGCAIEQPMTEEIVFTENVQATTENTNMSAIGEGEFEARVTYITDGDTLKVIPTSEKLPEGLSQDEEITLRLLLIDTPEWTKEKMPWGDQATARMNEIAPVGTNVKVYYDHGNKQDKYGRHLVYLFSEKGMTVQEILLREGLAMVRYIYPPGITLHSNFIAAEDEARNKSLNIWSVEGYVTEKNGFNPNVVEGGLSGVPPTF